MRAGVLAAVLLVGLTGCSGTLGQPGTGPTSRPSASISPRPPACLTMQPRHLEVCTAYVANASLAARYPYYQLGRSTDKQVADAAVRRLRSRYTGAAYQFLVRQTAGWPPRVRVSLPDIRVDAVRVAADEFSAVLGTHETWRVTDDAGRVLFAETNHPHTISMARVRGVVLHKWVVTAIG